MHIHVLVCSHMHAAAPGHHKGYPLELELQAIVNYLPGIGLRTEPGSSVRAVCILKTPSCLSLQPYLWLLLIP